MPTVTSVPGVYIEEDASPAMLVSQGATAIPLFVGRFKPLKPELAGVITRVSSWLDYFNLFDATVNSSAHVSVTSTLLEQEQYNYQINNVELLDRMLPMAMRLYFQNGGGPCYIYPLNAPEDDVSLASLPDLIDEIEDITLFVSLDANDSYRSAVYGALAASLNKHKGYFLLADSRDGNRPAGINSSAHVAVYYPDLVVSHIREFDDEQVTISGYINGEATTIVTLADLRKVNIDFANEIAQSVSFKMAEPMLIPPSSLMAGVYCKTDRERGVWKAPANVVLNGVSDVSVRVTDEEHGEMNQAGINVIRHFSERGLVVWGSRTLQNDDDWRYIPVRRLFNTAQRDIKKALQPIVFEPNSQPTWKRVQAAIENYLYKLWQQGGLAGDKVEEAYFVRVGKGITMTQDEINQGKMIIQIGMAAVRPAEFIILKFTQDMSQ